MSRFPSTGCRSSILREGQDLAEIESSGDRHVFLEAVLHPYRSLSRRGFIVLMVMLAAASLIAGLTCVAVGAWPIFGFFGLDVALVYVAFRASYRSARQCERIRLTERILTVERVSPNGQAQRWRFEPYWIRVDFNETDETNSLALASHGRTLVLGSFLAPSVRRDLAAHLKGALGRWRAFVADFPAQ
jgi:uncharacterized membrane protein